MDNAECRSEPVEAERDQFLGLLCSRERFGQVDCVGNAVFAAVDVAWLALCNEPMLVTVLDQLYAELEVLSLLVATHVDHDRCCRDLRTV